jgi:hypothetical protein
VYEYKICPIIMGKQKKHLAGKTRVFPHILSDFGEIQWQDILNVTQRNIGDVL